MLQKKKKECTPLCDFCNAWISLFGMSASKSGNVLVDSVWGVGIAGNGGVQDSTLTGHLSSHVGFVQ